MGKNFNFIIPKTKRIKAVFKAMLKFVFAKMAQAQP